MSKIAHTTGPWDFHPIGSKGDIGVYVRNAPPSAGVICRLPYTECKPQRENARLIAAAPDLLAVADEIINNQEALPAYLVAMAVHAAGRAKG